MTLNSWSGVDYTSVGRKLKEIVDNFPGNHSDYYITSSHRPHTPNSHHGGQLSYGGSSTSAIDIGFSYNGGSASTARGREFAEWLEQFSGNTVELIHVYGSSGNDGVFVKNTNFVGPYAVSTHRNHIHFAASSEQADRILSQLESSNNNNKEEDDSNTKPPEEGDLLDMAKFTYSQMDSQEVDLDKGSTFTIPWHDSNRHNVSSDSPYASVMFGNHRYQTVANVHVSGEGRYELMFGKLRGDTDDLSWSDTPHVTLSKVVTDEPRSQLACFDHNQGDERLRLWIKALDDGLTLTHAKVTSWHYKDD